MLQAVQFSINYLDNVSQPWPTYGTSKDECIFLSPCSFSPWCLCWACQLVSLKELCLMRTPSFGPPSHASELFPWTSQHLLFPTMISDISFVSLPMLTIRNSWAVSHSSAWKLLASVDVFFLNSDCHTPPISHYIIQSVLYLIWTNRFYYYGHT